MQSPVGRSLHISGNKASYLLALLLNIPSLRIYDWMNKSIVIIIRIRIKFTLADNGFESRFLFLWWVFVLFE